MGIYEDIRKIRVCIDQLGQITLGNINIDATSFIERTASASGPGYAAGNQIVISLSNTGAPDTAYNLSTGQAIAVPAFGNLTNEGATPAFIERVARSSGTNYAIGDRIILLLDGTGNATAGYNATQDIVLSPAPPEDDLAYATGVGNYAPTLAAALHLEIPRLGDGAASVAAAPPNRYRPAESGSAAFLLSETTGADNLIPTDATWGIVQFQAPPSALAVNSAYYARDMVFFSLDGEDVVLSTTTGGRGFGLGHLGYLILNRAQLLLLKVLSNASAAENNERPFAIASFFTGDPPPLQIVHGPLMDGDGGTVAANETNLTFEVYDLDGSLNGVVATPYGGSGSTGAPGDSVTVSPPWRYIEWEFTRAANPDPGDGSTSVFAVNGLGYLPGAGPAYGPEGGSFGSPQFENTTQSMAFVAYGGATVQIKVTR